MIRDEMPYISRPGLFERLNEQAETIRQQRIEIDNLWDRVAKLEAEHLQIELPSEGSRDEDFDVVAGIRERLGDGAEAGSGAVRAEPVGEPGPAPVAESESEPRAEPRAVRCRGYIEFGQFSWPVDTSDSDWYYCTDTGTSV